MYINTQNTASTQHMDTGIKPNRSRYNEEGHLNWKSGHHHRRIFTVITQTAAVISTYSSEYNLFT